MEHNQKDFYVLVPMEIYRDVSGRPILYSEWGHKIIKSLPAVLLWGLLFLVVGEILPLLFWWGYEGLEGLAYSDIDYITSISCEH